MTKRKPGYLIVKEYERNTFGSFNQSFYPTLLMSAVTNTDENDIRDWLIENIAPCHEVTAGSRSGGKVHARRWQKVSSAFVLCMDEHPFEILKTTSRIVYSHSKNHSWEHFSVDYSRDGKQIMGKFVRLYDEVLAVQLKLQVC